MHRKTKGIVDAAVTLGAAKSTDFSGGGVVQTLKELAVATGCARDVSEVDANSISGVLNFIADNGESIVYPEPTGTKSITTNGTHDVKDYASAEVSVPAPSVEFAGINITNNTEETVNVINSLVIDGGKLKTQDFEIAPNGEGMASVDYGAYGVNVFYRLKITILQGADKTYAVSPATGTSCNILYQGRAGNHKMLNISVEKQGVISMDKFPAITITEDK